MLTLECALVEALNKYNLFKLYGINIDDQSKTILKTLTTYKWLTDNASSCLTACQLEEITTFINTCFYGVEVSNCEDIDVQCPNITYTDITPTGCDTLQIKIIE